MPRAAILVYPTHIELPSRNRRTIVEDQLAMEPAANNVNGNVEGAQAGP